MRVSSSFNQLSFHDALISEVRREKCIVEIDFNFVIITPEHQMSDGVVVELKNASVLFSKVQSERALIWHDDKAPLKHPNPTSPIREVMHGTRKVDSFHFDGFWEPDDWSEWYIYSDTFEVRGDPVEFSRTSF